MALLKRLEQFGSTGYGLAVLFAVPLIAIFAPLLSAAHVPAWGDDVIQTAASFAFWSRALHSGASALWNPDNLAGFPAFATAFGFFAPWNLGIAWLIRDPFAFLTVLPWFTFLVFVAGAVCTAKLLQAFGLSFWSAYLGGVAYTVSHQTDAFFMPVVLFHLFLPLLWFIVWKLSGRASRWWALGGVLTVGLAWLAVNFQETFYILLVTPLFAWFVARLRRSRGEVVQPLRFAALLALIYLLGTAIGLVQLLPTQLMAERSTRAAGVSYEFASEDALLPTDFLRWVIPDFELPLGIPFGSRGATVPLYMGIIPLFFFLSAAIYDRSLLAAFFRWLFLGTTAIAIIYSPIFWLMTKLPVFSYFRVPDRWMFLAVFSAAILAAIGLERFVRLGDAGGASGADDQRFFRWFAGCLSAILLGLVVMNVVLGFFETPAKALAKSFFAGYLYGWYQPTGAVPLGHYLAIIDRYFGDLHRYLSFREPIVAAGAVAVVASLGAIAILRKLRPHLAPAVLGAILVAVAAGNWVLVKRFDYTSIPASVHDRTPPTITFLQAHPGRTMPVLYEHFEESVARPRYGLAGPDGVIYRFAMLVPNTNLFYGVESATIKDGLEPMAISRLMSLVGAPTIGIPREFPQSDPVAAAATLVQRKSLLDFLGIRYLVSGYPLDELVFPAVFQVGVTSKQIPLTIYENQGARPLAWLTPQARFLRADTEAIFRAYRDAGFQGVLADCPASCPPGEYLFGNGSAELLAQGNGRAVVKTSLAAAPGFLVFSQNHLPGWRAFVDGVAVQRYTVNSVFIGVVVPTGEHEVEFRYGNPCGGWAVFDCVRSLIGVN